MKHGNGLIYQRYICPPFGGNSFNLPIDYFLKLVGTF